MIASPPLKNQELSQPSIFDLTQTPDTATEPGFLSKAEDILLEQYIAATDTSAAATRKTIASIYILMVAQKGDRESHKYGSFNKLCESRAQVWGFSVSQCYRIGQASQQREVIRERAVAEGWEVGDVDEIADSVFLEMERVEEEFQREVLEAANLDFGQKGGITGKSLEKAINFVSERYENPAIVAKPKQKKSGGGSSGGEGGGSKVAELQDLLVKERQRRVELEEKLDALSKESNDQRVAELEAHCEALLNELDQLRASTQPNPDELELLVNQRVESIRQQLEAEMRRDLQAQIVEAEALRLRVAQLEEQLSKVAVDVPTEELIPTPEQPKTEQFWRRKEHLKHVSNEGRLKAADAETAYIRCDNRSPEEQIQLSLERQTILEQELEKEYGQQRRHSPTSPLRTMNQPIIDEIQEEIAFEQQLRLGLGYQEPQETVVVEEGVDEISEDAFTQITTEDLDEIRQFLKNYGISKDEFISECLTPRRYDRAGLLTKQQLKEVWVELEGIAELKPINEDELQELLAFASESGISDVDFRAAVLTPHRYNDASQILRCQLPEVRKALEDIIEF